MSQIKVLIVDDSPLLQEIMSRGISADPDLTVVARASDAFEARDKILEFRPDVMTCDIQMPKMDGIEFIRRLIPQYSMPVIVVSSISEAVFDALGAGAVEFVAKPSPNGSREAFIEELVQKVKIAARAKIRRENRIARSRSIRASASGQSDGQIIAIGASTGGTEAIYHVLRQLPSTAPGIVIVQHIPPVFSRMFADRLNQQTAFSVKEAEDGDLVERGKVLLAPGSRQMRVKKDNDRYRVECFDGERVNGHSPSADVLFRSVASVAGRNAIGVILTGMGADGAKGLLEMRKEGARTIGQDQKSCVVYGMPKVAFDLGAVERQGDLDEIPAMILELLGKNKAQELRPE